MPGAAAQIRRMTGSGRAVPVGLLGEVRNTTSGRSAAMTAAACSGSRPKSASRAPLTHRVPVDSEMSGCIE